MECPRKRFSSNSRYLFGYRFGSYYIYVYVGSLVLAAVWTQDLVINILDTSFALMAIPTLISTLLLSPRVVAATRDYYRRLRGQAPPADRQRR